MECRLVSSRLLMVLLMWLPSLVSGISIISYAALGDSYASGNGAGSIDNIFCGRFSGAYPVIVAQKLVLEFKNLACAGALTSTVLSTQVPFVGQSDLVTVEVGGNEANFFSVLNGCVKQWLPFQSCKEAVATTYDIIDSPSFAKRYDSFIKETTSYLHHSTNLLVLGYARFFNADTDACDNTTFSESDPTNLLTKDKRDKMNGIVLKLNSVIKSAAEAHGAYYVDIDKVFEGHRFCETGAIEPSRTASWFFNDLGSLSSLHSLSANSKTESLRNLDGGYFELTKSFHPTLEGHTAIANEIIRMTYDL